MPTLRHGNAIGTTSKAAEVEVHLRPRDPSIVLTAVNLGGESAWQPFSNWLRRYFKVPESFEVEVVVIHNRSLKTKTITISTEAD